MAGNEGERPPSHLSEETRRLLSQMAAEQADATGSTNILELTGDSVFEIMGLGTSKDPSYPRRLTFESEPWSLELEVTDSGTRRSLDGSLRGGQPGQVITVRLAEASMQATLDQHAKFHLPDVAPGAMSLTWETPEHGHFETGWVSI